MAELLVVAAGIGAGLDWRLSSLLIGALWFPAPTAVAVAVVGAVGRRVERTAEEGRDVRFLESVLGELRTGASLRMAVRTGCRLIPGSDTVVRRLDVGDPLAGAVAPLATMLARVGPLVVDAVGAAAGGGRLVPVFEELLLLAAADAEVEAEVRSSTAQVRASLMILVGGPLSYLAWAGFTGRLGRLLTLPGGAVVGGAGMALFVVGVAVMALLARSRR